MFRMLPRLQVLLPACFAATPKSLFLSWEEGWKAEALVCKKKRRGRPQPEMAAPNRPAARQGAQARTLRHHHAERLHGHTMER